MEDLCITTRGHWVAPLFEFAFGPCTHPFHCSHVLRVGLCSAASAADALIQQKPQNWQVSISDNAFLSY